MDFPKGVNLTSVRLILFDLDGTLIVTGTDYASAREKIRSLFRKEGLGEDFDFKPVLPKILLAASQLTSNKAKQESLVAQALEFINQVENEAAATSTILNGVKDTLAFFRQQKVLLGIFSRTSLGAIDTEIEKFGLGSFDIIIGRETTQPKPEPGGILLALENLKVKKEYAWVVGDFIYDMQAAVAANVLGIGVLTGVSSKQELVDSGAQVVLNSVEELVSLYIRSQNTVDS